MLQAVFISKVDPDEEHNLKNTEGKELFEDQVSLDQFIIEINQGLNASTFKILEVLRD